MATSKGSDLVPFTEYAIQQVDARELAEILQDNVGGNLTEFDLTRAKIPTGGMTAWSVPTLSGEDDIVTALEGVIVYHREPRAYWQTPFDQSGGGSPPDCSSTFGDRGVGTPGGDCGSCPLAQWGSKPATSQGGESRGQACKQMKLIFLLRPGSLLPTALFLPPTSIVPARKYLLGLASEAQRYTDVLTRITLEKDKNNDGIEYAKAKFARAGILDVDDATRVREYAAGLKASLDTVTITPDDIPESD